LRCLVQKPDNRKENKRFRYQKVKTNENIFLGVKTVQLTDYND